MYEIQSLELLRKLIKEGKRLLETSSTGVSYYAFDFHRIKLLEGALHHMKLLRSELNTAEKDITEWRGKYQAEKMKNARKSLKS